MHPLLRVFILLTKFSWCCFYIWHSFIGHEDCAKSKWICWSFLGSTTWSCCFFWHKHNLAGEIYHKAKAHRSPSMLSSFTIPDNINFVIHPESSINCILSRKRQPQVPVILHLLRTSWFKILPGNWASQGCYLSQGKQLTGIKLDGDH